MGDFEEALNSMLSSPKDMEKILGLAREISGSGGDGEERKAPPPPKGAQVDPLGGLGDLDPRIFKLLGRVMGSGAEDRNKSALISAMSPYLRPNRQRELARAFKIAKLTRIARVALSEFGGGDSDFDL